MEIFSCYQYRRQDASGAQDEVQPKRLFFAVARAAAVVFDAQMAAVQAVLRAAGLVSPNKELLSESTATEHALKQIVAERAQEKIVALLAWRARRSDQHCHGAASD